VKKVHASLLLRCCFSFLLVWRYLFSPPQRSDSAARQRSFLQSPSFPLARRNESATFLSSFSCLLHFLSCSECRSDFPSKDNTVGVPFPSPFHLFFFSWSIAARGFFYSPSPCTECKARKLLGAQAEGPSSLSFPFFRFLCHEVRAKVFGPS